ncbi:23S rRNA (uracil(1939)-C(5))-methyltransferase RlmD [Mycoplasmopsis mucosicanis]|uniref:23S rRNA (Uracil(1939)-C(5))-methyltransferase RlmD n=1 Tax=Mycoplasmopsis mucosicanis TaxID=458208 RepID=A0A507SQ26_9BACT|nr:23S rRNA (uracil(1939)-C(5))-methyltransferase RlmD [Mycoplasmopsis mucosicanis]TQC51482.1 23S rRNA (uracil(1939)-C(5))-methyltransferase RlmD [Mycoplasmopsis mucosicanis]
MNIDKKICKNGHKLNNVKATAFSYEGYGIIQYDNYKIFVENLLIDEVADIEIKKANNNYAFAKVLKYHKYSPMRIETKNNELLASGAAPLSMISYDDQLKLKQEIINYYFKRNLNYEEIKPILSSHEAWNYRNKLTVFVKFKERIVIGLFEKNTHNIIEQSSYDLACKEINDILQWISSNINNYKLMLKYAKFIKSITIRHSKSKNESLIIFNISQKFTFDMEFVRDLTLKFKNVVNIILNNESIISKEQHFSKFLNAKTTITEKIDNDELVLNWNSFFQVNSAQTNNLYNLLIDNLNLTGNETIVDAYCGVGSISLKLAKKAKKVYGLEIIPEAVENAEINCSNYINTVFFAGDVLKTIDKITDKIDIIVVDPPRSGNDKEFLEKILNIGARKIGYVSCNFHTLIRDIHLIMTKGYKIKFVQPCDMFPQTYHIETVVVLEKE